MSNPILTKFFNETHAPRTVPVQTNQYGDPNQAYAQYDAQTQAQSSVLTYDDVITKSAICLGTVMGVGAITFALTPLPASYVIAILFSLVAGVAGSVISLKKWVTAPLAVGYAAVEGMAIGAISRMFEYFYPGVVPQAVYGTFIAAAAIFVIVKYCGVRPTGKMRQVMGITTIAYSVAMLLNFVLHLAGINLGLVDHLGSVSLLGVLMCLLGTALAVYSLLQDFADVFDSVEYGVESKQAWRLAFGLTVSMVWLYINILRILAYLRSLSE